MATSSSRESLKAQRHQLYCGIADALSVPGSGSADILSRLQTVLEAEACLSCIDGEDSAVHEPASTKSLAPAAATSKPSAGHLAMSALQDLKAELAQRVQQTMKPARHHSKSMSCSSLLADLRAVQQEKASLAEQLAAARAAAAGQRKQHEQEVRKHKRAVEQATQLVEAANSRMLELEQQLAVDSQEAASQTQQLAEQAKSTVRLGAELRQVKQHMKQLHLSVVHPVLHWQHEQQQQQGAEGTSSTRTSCSSSSRRKRSHKQWQPPATVTADVIAAAAAAVEQLLLRQAQQEQGQQRTSEHALLQRLQGKLACRDAEMQELRAELAACRQEAAHLQQQQLDTARTQHEQSQQLHEQELAAKAQQAAKDAEQQLQAQQQALQELQQHVNKLLSELACAQGEAAAAQRQVARLQEDQQQAAAEHERQLQQLKQVASSRVHAEAASEDCSKVQELQLEHIQAVAAARLEGQQALADAQRAWAAQQAAAEKQHLQALLRCKQAQETDRLQWQRERDELVQQLTAQYTASGLQVHMEAREQLRELQHQVEQLQRERDEVLLLQQSRAPASPDRQRLAHSFRHSLQQPHSYTTADGTRGGEAVMQGGSGRPAAFALQFSRALQTADADRSVAVRRAAAAEQTAAELRQQLGQQEQELAHLRRALDELRNACAAATDASAEAEASAAASSSALQEQVALVRQLQQRLDEAGERHHCEMRALRQSMAEQVAVVQADARAELEAAQTRLQLVRLKQQRMCAGMLSS